ncbi:MAG: hypothetical protein IJU95_10185, partial [Treponema sp.]|nr:hypothetical protein [Treponema sp.]
IIHLRVAARLLPVPAVQLRLLVAGGGFHQLRPDEGFCQRPLVDYGKVQLTEGCTAGLAAGPAVAGTELSPEAYF